MGGEWPAPGSYKIKEGGWDKGAKMAKDKKFRGGNAGETPGPGSYKIEGTLG